jgi:pimeloyl-ACP methyl ester carboxylesterase
METILLLHGALGSKSQLDALKAILEAEGLTVYSTNFSGHSGESFRNDFGIETFTQDVLRFLRKNQLQRVHIFGYSMGGYVALWFAQNYPEHVGKIVTLGTKFDWSPESAEKEVKKLNPEKIQEKIPAFARILEHRHAPNDWKELLHKTASMMIGLGNKPLLNDGILKSIRTNTLILLGDQDDMADRNYSQHVAQVLPHSTFRLLDNTPHPIEKMDIKVLLKTLQEHFRN